ncbi:uncharacterized mitochondrial protein AtMg00810-like [Arachis hypogaea]|uniref:uncharacterized mitochondrial protein AtMg00810-like n=1 Tax=Arachis hypogaea TaxID=3818 RepID=UPI003B20EC3F
MPEWKATIDAEYNALMQNQTWKRVLLPQDREALGSRWVFQVKYNLNGSLQKYKAHFMVQDFSQRPDFNFIEMFKNGSSLFVLVYVDDIIITGDSDDVTKTASGDLVLSQEKYANNLLKKFDMEHYKPCPTPLPSSIKFSSFGGSTFKDTKLYRSVVSSLQYLTVTRLELAYCVGKVL